MTEEAVPGDRSAVPSRPPPSTGGPRCSSAGITRLCPLVSSGNADLPCGRQAPLEEPDELATRLSVVISRRTAMMRQMPLLASVALLLTCGIALAQNQPQTPSRNEPSAPQVKGRSPATTLPETKTVAPDASGAPIKQTGQAPNVSRKMDAEMDSPGDQRASPDEQ